MKKITKLMTMFLIMLFVVPVFAEEVAPISIENIMGTTLNEDVVLNATDSIDVTFNDLKQDATYKITLKNNTDEVVYVNDVVTENLSEEFIEFSLTDKSLNTMIEPGKESDVEVEVKTLDITHAGRNLEDEVTLKFLLGKSVSNPETYSNWIVYVILIGTLLITISTMFSKLDKKKKLSIFVIGTLVLGTTVVSANDDDILNLSGKVKYISQNLLHESGTKLEGYDVSYVNSIDVWKYADQVKNIVISDEKIVPNEYAHKYDLSINNSKRIYGYLVENGDSKTKYDLYIVANGVIYAPDDATGLFSFPNVETIKGLEYIEFDNTTNMSAMFMNDEKLKNIDSSLINTSGVTNAAYMFSGCDKLNLSEMNFDLEKAENKTHMFNQNLNDVVKLNAKSDKDTNFATTPVTGKYMVESTKNDANPVYYYRGAVTENNVLFGGYCWKMVRTTEKGGTKLIYNGTPKTTSSSTKLSSESYVVSSNNSESPFSFNTSTNRWVSSNKSHRSSSAIEFSVANAGEYIINYIVSSEKSFDWAYFYKDDILLKKVSGYESSAIALGNITPSTKIRVEYIKDGSTNQGSNNVMFEIVNSSSTKFVCNNTGSNSHIGNLVINSSTMGSPAYLGYMYGEVYSIAEKKNMSSYGELLYGNDVTWDGTKYTLVDTKSADWAAKETVSTKYHYTCYSSAKTCDVVYYVNYFGSDNISYYITLKSGDKIEDAMRKMYTNDNSSPIKEKIDDWYKYNLISFESQLEDAVWCNDRSFEDGALLSKDSDGIDISHNGPSIRNFSDSKPSLACKEKRDRFTVNEVNGNRNLTYPVGLLTSDELTYAGSSKNVANTYLNIGLSQWSMSPFYVTTFRTRVGILAANGRQQFSNSSTANTIRPAIVLKSDTNYVAGNGTVNDPYIVK